MSIKVMKQALDALEKWSGHYPNNSYNDVPTEALRQAIEQEEKQEPEVAYVHLIPDQISKNYDVRFYKPVPMGTKLYTSPPDQSDEIKRLKAVQADYDNLLVVVAELAVARNSEIEGLKSTINDCQLELAAWDKSHCKNAEYEALKADAARMDHLVSRVKCRGADIGGWHTWGFNFNQGWKTGGSFREAIDQSMKEAS